MRVHPKVPPLDYLLKWVAQRKAFQVNRPFRDECGVMDDAWHHCSPRAQEKLKAIQRLIEETISGLPDRT